MAMQPTTMQTTRITASIISLAQLLRAKRVGNEVMSAQSEFGDALRGWLQRLTPKIVGHFKNWPQWSSDDIVDWMMSLEHARFAKYETHLRTEMKRADLRGKHLKILATNLTHLQRFGIVNFEDETSLHSYINALVDGRYQQSIMKQLLAMPSGGGGGGSVARSRSKSPRMAPPSTAMKFSKSYQGPLHAQTSSGASTKPPFTLSANANRRRRSPSPQLQQQRKERVTPGQLSHPRIHAKQSRSHPKLLLFSNNSSGDGGGGGGVSADKEKETASTQSESGATRQKIRLLEHEYHDMQTRKIAQQRAKLEQDKKEFMELKQKQSVALNDK